MQVSFYFWPYFVDANIADIYISSLASYCEVDNMFFLGRLAELIGLS